MVEEIAQTEAEKKLAELIVDTLSLPDVQADNIHPIEPLFREGLGLDSIDALEIALAISVNYGVKLKANDSNNTQIFSSLRSLSKYIQDNKV